MAKDTKEALTPYAFPEYGVTIEAKDLQEANEKLKEILDK